MIIPDVLLVLAAGLVTGILIGAVGVGGVLIAPLLVLLAGFEVHEAIAVASFSFIFTGVVGAVSYAGRGNVNWHAAVWGTGAGVGTAWMTSSLGDGASLLSVELDGQLADAAASLFVSHSNVEVVAGDWVDVLPAKAPVPWLPVIGTCLRDW